MARAHIAMRMDSHTLTATHIRTQLLTRKTALEINKSFEGLSGIKLKLCHAPLCYSLRTHTHTAWG